MRADVLTIFPEMFTPLRQSIIGRACEKGLLDLHIHNIRDFTTDKHRVTDDYPYGGGVGMVMKPEPIFRAARFCVAEGKKEGRRAPRIILMCPQGRVFNQDMARELSTEEHLVLVCGHYEGVDERVRQHLVTDEISIGDYVLTGGELAAMVVIDATVRLIPGVLKEEESFLSESFYSGVLDFPQYTRPFDFEGLLVPEVLTSGDHEKIRLWRRKEALLRTYRRRPDLLAKAELSEEDRRLLDELAREGMLGPKA